MKTTLLFLSIFFSVNLFGQNVYIPDPNFKAYLVGSVQNTNGDEEIQVSEATAWEVISCSNSNISDLTGIEAFTNITMLHIGGNQLTSIDVSQNTALESFACDLNLLTSLDLSQNTALTHVWCHWNQLTALDVSQNTALTKLYCHYNQLTDLDVSQNTALTTLNCSYNQLTCLNIANGNNFYFGPGYSVVDENPNLTCIEVSDAEWSTVNSLNIDPQMYYSEYCNNDCSSSNAEITELNTSKNLIQILDMMGREATFKPNTPLIYVYDDGSTEKVFSVEY